MLKLTWARAAAWRVHRHRLDQRSPPGSMLAVASRLCGLHAQVLSSAELSVWARVENLHRDAVRHALWNQRTLVKTWAMRGTLHLLPAREISLWHAALRDSRRYRSPGLLRRFGITQAEMERLTEAIGAALAGRLLAREELAREVARITGSANLGAVLAQSSWGTILKPAAFAGRLCFGPSVGTRVQFTCPATWLSKRQKPMDSQAAALSIVRRYLAAYGPATNHDLGRWWGCASMAMVRRWIASLSGEIAEVDVDGQRAWMLATDLHEARELPSLRSARLLPAFDHYVVAASRYADQLLPGVPRGLVYRPQGWISPVLLVNGMMSGVWRHEIKGSNVEVTIEPFVKLNPWVRRAAGEEADRLAEFLGSRAKLVWKV